jgi:hypothetical protein
MIRGALLALAGFILLPLAQAVILSFTVTVPSDTGSPRARWA